MTLLHSITANSALYDRGSGLIYEDVLDITWLQDAHYTVTSGYVHANLRQSDNVTENINGDGSVGWNAAKAWAEGLVYLSRRTANLTPNFLLTHTSIFSICFSKITAPTDNQSIGSKCVKWETVALSVRVEYFLSGQNPLIPTRLHLPLKR